MDIDLGQALGAEPGDVSVQCITLYIPDRDRDGKPIDQGAGSTAPSSC